MRTRLAQVLLDGPQRAFDLHQLEVTFVVVQEVPVQDGERVPDHGPGQVGRAVHLAHVAAEELGRQHVLDGSADHQLVLVGHLDAHVGEKRVDNLFTAQQQLVHVVDGVPDRLIGKAVQLLLQIVKQRHVVLRIHKHHLPQPLEELEHLHLPLAGRRRHLQPTGGPSDRRQRNQLRDVGTLAHLQLNVLQLMHQHVHLPRQFLALQTLRTDARRRRIEQTLFAPDALVTDPMILDLAALDAITADVNLAQVLAPVFPRGLLVVRAVVQRELVALVDVAAGTCDEQAVRDHGKEQIRPARVLQLHRRRVERPHRVREGARLAAHRNLAKVVKVPVEEVEQRTRHHVFRPLALVMVHDDRVVAGHAACLGALQLLLPEALYVVPRPNLVAEVVCVGICVAGVFVVGS
uniref:(northern house mosquito) hypothetical protein n=1 Tax=Culex pipiens TaxID=7175 RepID=A0A8D8BDY4_CULPI